MALHPDRRLIIPIDRRRALAIRFDERVVVITGASDGTGEFLKFIGKAAADAGVQLAP
jgi:hypothetical protein